MTIDLNIDHLKVVKKMYYLGRANIIYFYFFAVWTCSFDEQQIVMVHPTKAEGTKVRDEKRKKMRDGKRKKVRDGKRKKMCEIE